MKARLMHCLPLLFLALAANACAQESAPASNVLYRCTDAKGNLTIQNAPCPAGMREQKQTVGALKTAPLPGAQPFVPNSTPPPNFHPDAQPDATAKNPQDSAAADATAPNTTAAGNCDGTPRADNAPRLPPPALFQCTTYDNDGYISEDPMPPPRRVPLQTTGLNGDPRLGQGQAWEVKHDSCARVPDGKLCDAWRKRLGETEVAWRYGKPENVAKNKVEYQRVLRIVGDACH